MTMELLQCDCLERKLKLAFAHTVSKLGSPVSGKVLVVVMKLVTKQVDCVGSNLMLVTALLLYFYFCWVWFAVILQHHCVCCLKTRAVRISYRIMMLFTA